MKATNTALVVAALAASLLWIAPANANLLINGSFEQADPDYVNPPADPIAPYNFPASSTRWENLSQGLTHWMRLEEGVGPADSALPPLLDNDDHLDYRAMLGWTIHGNFDWKSGDNGGATPGQGAWRASDGNMSMDLNGHGAGGISQTIDVPSDMLFGTYVVSFDLSGNPWDGGTQAGDPAGIRTIEVAVGVGPVTSMSSNAGQSTFAGGVIGYWQFEFDTNDPNGDGDNSDALADYDFGSPITNMHWQNIVFDFLVAPDYPDDPIYEQGLTFLFHSLTPGYAGPALDNTTVLAFLTPVPEPATLGLLAAGAMGMLIRRRRRRGA